MLFDMIPLPYRILAGAAFLALVGGFGFREGLRYDHDQIVQLQAAQQVAAAQFQAHNASVEAQQAKDNVQAEQAHVQAITSLNDYWSNLMRQRAKASGRAVSPLPKPPTSINAIPTDALPLGSQCANTTQQLEDLQKWVRDQQNIR